jgi:sugar phosphate isomerase/epimerase
MAKTKTAGGTIERGKATQRHFVRAVDNDDELDANVVVSFGTGAAGLSVKTEAAYNRVRELAEEFGVDLRVEWFTDDEHGGEMPIYDHSNALALRAEFEA